MDTSYIGEHLLPGQTGHFLVIFSFVTSLLAAVSYFIATNLSLQNNSSLDAETSLWEKTGRWSFYLQSLSLLGIIACLFYIIYNHFFEYHYAWSHSSKALPVHYMVSCFWEGQEGSFLLWAFWQTVLGIVFIKAEKKWAAPVMSMLALSQVFLLSMLLGIYLGEFKIGSNPFILLRDAMADAPIFLKPDYLNFIEDGRGLNPLLQNYWMVIHPPTLFLGFASTIIPFAFAVSGLWKKQYTEWISVALPWTLFSVLVLGTGIIMGGAWAYESLTFGGFWAWDPVENASIIPWITIIAAVHVMVISKNTGNAVLTSFSLTIITFLLVLYASFLTRSGILGDSSVHSFTDLGLGGQLVSFMAVFILIPIIFLVKNWRKIPRSVNEEKTYSREFWMFIGALVLCISAFQIIFSTSIPVLNKLFGTNLAPPVNAVEHYNSWQLPIAIILGILTAVSQFFKYKNTPTQYFFRKVLLALAVSIITTVALIFFLGISFVHYCLLLFAGSFAIFGNMDYIVRVMKGKIPLSGAAIAHIGFGLVLVGALISQSKQSVISNTTGSTMEKLKFDKEMSKENMLLVKNNSVLMQDYKVTYKGFHKEGPDIFYKVDYEKIDPFTGSTLEMFSLFPNAQINPQMGLISNPDTRHYLLKDIYTHVTSIPDNEGQSAYKEIGIYEVLVNDTIVHKDMEIVVDGLNKNPDIGNIRLEPGDLAVGLKLNIIYNNKSYHAEPIYLIQNNATFNIESSLEEIGKKFRFTKISPEKEKIEIRVLEKSEDYIVMKAIIFPYINVLWLGTVVLVIGFFIAIRRRIVENRRQILI